MRLLAVLFGLMVVGGGLLFVLVPGGLVDHLSVWRWKGGVDGPWPAIERMDVAVRLDPLGGFFAQGKVAFAGVTGSTVRFLLNTSLRVDEATLSGESLSVGHGFKLDSRYHSEGRVVYVRLPDPPTDGRVTLQLQWSGAVEHGRQGHDWRGILLVDDDEARMCEQTIFVPMVPVSLSGPGALLAPFSLSVDAPTAWELASSVAPLDLPPRVEGESRRLWRFESARPVHPAILGGVWVRSESSFGDATLTCLLRDEHSGLSDSIMEDARQIMADFTATYGGAPGGSITLVEQNCRPSSSYNWTAEALVVMDTNAMGRDEVPVDTLAHELGHLWWGQAMRFDGPGERFLTEGAAEAASWGFLTRNHRIRGAAFALANARTSLAGLVSRSESLALSQMGFESPRYQELAYKKGALVQRWVAGMLGPDGQRAVVSRLMQHGRDGVVTLEQWRAAIDELVPGLSVPWVEHGGELSLELEDVVLAPDGSSVTGVVVSRVVAEPMPPEVAAVVAVTGVGFERRQLLTVSGRAPFSFDLSDLPQARVQTVVLDPDDLMPTACRAELVFDGPLRVESDPSLDDDQVAMGPRQIRVRFDRPLVPVDLLNWLAECPPVPTAVQVPSVADISFEENGHVVVFSVRPLMPAKDYWLPLRGALRDGDGGPCFDQFLRFRTAPSSDKHAPRVIHASLAQGASDVDVGLQSVVLTWNEPMQAGTGFKRSDCEQLAERGFSQPPMNFGRWDDSGTELTIPFRELAPETAYGLPFGINYRDLSGNAAERFDLTFTTGEIEGADAP